MTKKSNSLKAFCRALKKHNRYLITCHVSPEGDAAGSALAMQSLLKKMGKKATVVCEDVFPERLAFLPHKAWRTFDGSKFKAGDFDALVVTDCPNMERIGKIESLITSRTVIFNIDHHVSNIYFGHYNYVCPKAAASGEVVYELFNYLKTPISKQDAILMYAALSTDTGSFKYGNTTINCHHMAADLIRKGVPIEKVNEELYATYSLQKIRLFGELFSKVKIAHQGTIAWAALRRADLEKAGATYEDTDGLIEFLKFIRTVKIAFFISEKSGNEIKVSLRSRGNYDVNRVAKAFRGGGHRKAAGCTLAGTLESAEERILSEVKKELGYL